MIWAELLWGLIALVLVLDARRIQSRLAALTVLRPDESEGAGGHVWVLAPGIELDERTRGFAEAHREAKGLSALDIVPAKLRSTHHSGFESRTMTAVPND